MKSYIFLLAIIILSSSAMAVTNLGNHSIQTNYIEGDDIRGIVELKFTNVSSETLLTSNFRGQIKLVDFLNANSLQGSYNCTTNNCMPTYKRNSAIATLQINGAGSAGISFDGQTFENIDDIKLRVRSDSGPSCNPQLSVNVADSENVSSTRYRNEVCFEPNYGCFNSQTTYQNVQIPHNSRYCEKMTLKPAPAYLIGANITRQGNDNVPLVMRIFEVNGSDSPLTECTLPPMTAQTQERECVAEYSSAKEKDYLVCIQSESVATYTLRAESTNPCGTSNLGQTYPIDYEIFAKNLKFDSPDIMIDNSVSGPSGETLNEHVRNYITSRYNNQCNPSCIVPISFSGESQNLIFSEVSVIYDIDGAQNIQSNSLYSITRESPKISSQMLSLEIGRAHFSIPFGTNEASFKLSIEGTQLLSVPINISKSFNFAISPRFVLIGQNTAFRLTGAINSSTWDFGDGTPLRTFSGNTANHVYATSGLFNVSIEATNSEGKIARKKTTILAGEPRESANRTLEEYSTRLENTKNYIASLPGWLQSSVSSKIDVIGSETTLTTLRQQFAIASTDEDYEAVVTGLLGLKMPYAINSSLRGSAPLVLGNNVNFAHLEEISSTPIEDKTQAGSALAYWMSKHYNSRIEFDSISAFYDEGAEPLFTKFIINTQTKEETQDSVLVIDYAFDNIKFMQDYGEQRTDSGTYLPIKEVIEFAILDAASPQELGVYIAPKNIEELGIGSALMCKIDNVCDKLGGENKDNCPDDCSTVFGTAFIIVVVIFIIAVLALIFIWTKYRKKYEGGLFKNKNDFYNITIFITNSRRAGLSDKEIKQKLAKAGWKHDQIEYALKKINDGA